MCPSCALVSIERDWCLETQEVFGGYNIFKTDQMRFVRQKIQLTRSWVDFMILLFVQK